MAEALPHLDGHGGRRAPRQRRDPRSAGATARAEFEFTLDLLLDGLARAARGD